MPKKSQNPKESSAGDEYITVKNAVMSADMLEQQRIAFKDMMDLQEKNFPQLFMEMTNKRVD